MKTHRFATSQDAEIAFYEALERADLNAMMAVWAEEDIICIHPGSPRFCGVAEVRESWRQMFGNGATMRFYLSDMQILRGALLAVHTLYEHIQIKDAAQMPPPMIATNVYALTDHGWRMVMHHASPAPDAPPLKLANVPTTVH